MSVSLDIPIDGGEELILADVLADGFDLEKEVIGEDSHKSVQIQRYLCRLSRRQREVVRLLADSYRAGEVQEILHLTRKEYADALSGIKSYENVSLLF